MSRQDSALTAFGGTASLRATPLHKLLAALARTGSTQSITTLGHYTNFLLIFPVLLFSVIAHEYAHGYAALKQGDTTALMLGRLTWNPVKHIDPFMTILLPLIMALGPGPILGGAKPVPVNPRNYRNFKRGDIIVSLAGVFTNLLVGIGCAIVVVLLGLLARLSDALGPSIGILQAMFVFGIYMNMVLILFNLIPIPPLDGSHVMKYLLPPAWSLRYQELGRYGLLVLILLLYFGQGVLQWWMTPALVAAGAIHDVAHPFMIPAADVWVRRVFPGA
jgi:Zn-dependent protease